MTVYAEIEALLAQYFDALYNSNAELLARVMHPKAIYASADERPLLYRTMGEYLPIVAARPFTFIPRRTTAGCHLFAGAGRSKHSLGQSRMRNRTAAFR
jgi:Putative lumazine-binding